ncbi:Bcr/CflA family efflux MFS transporter [Salipiger sp. IMCC34102]|uniref:multidrug effflux MFS transporter n=1 Tax=Salipiger sp. IMCC34102 TaxID=2510647 RepID=UPI00101D8E78|nr:multidrug effflux MFS transporter [Salipiger sp. IMCC34102]RYH01834.1 Bcr/CflA family efflux MFS transporter [Salipiger sp. IMCC34102]
MSDFPKARFGDRSTPPHIVTLTLLAGVSALNMSIFLPSLTRMAEDFGTDYATVQFAISGYLAATALLQVVVGPLSDRYGRRKVVMGALSVFMVATLGCYLATNVTVFLAFRILQAAVATGIVLSRAIVRDLFPPERSASMIGYVTMGMALIPMIGPTIGGTLDELFGWRSSFLFLMAAGGLVLTLCWADQGETVRGGGTSFKAQVANYPALLTAPRFWGYALCAAFASGSFFAFLGGASYVADYVFGLTPFQSGLALGAPAIGYAVGNGISGRFSERVGLNPMILWGCILAFAGMGLSLLLALAGLQDPLVFFGLCTFLGLGNGMTMPNATAGLLSVRPRLAGTASGLGGALMIGGGAALSQLAGVLLEGAQTAISLQALMCASGLGSIAAVAFVMWRERRLVIA